ncbi:MAG: hypothetical protein HY430_00715 [Candidatus Levybacteria bacterium]|nr:hypothetical protein [Candidatus Levybacteria bacterium]
MAAELDKLRRDVDQDFPFPRPKGKTAPETSQPRGLEPIEFAIDIPTVNEEVYLKTREAVEATGYRFVAAIRPVSIEDLIAEDSQREQEGKPGRLGHVNDSRAMRAIVPPEMEVAINPASVRIEGSNYLSTDDQIAKIQDAEDEWKELLPEDVRSLVSMRMVDPSTYSQLEDAYMDAREGQPLFPNYFARTDVPTFLGFVADVGRRGPDNQRNVNDWYRDSDNRSVFAVPVVVLPQIQPTPQDTSPRNPQDEILKSLGYTLDQIASHPDSITQDTKVYSGSLLHHDSEGKIIRIFERLEGVERIFTPEGEVQVYDLTIGGKDKDQLQQALSQGNFQVSSWSHDIMNKRDFKTLKDPQTIRLAKMPVAALGFGEGITPTTAQIYTRAGELGLDLCPAEVGPHQRLQDTDQDMNDWYWIAMKQITDSNGDPLGFWLGRNEDGTWLDCDWAGPDSWWDPEVQLVFSFGK